MNERRSRFLAADKLEQLEALLEAERPTTEEPVAGPGNGQLEPPIVAVSRTGVLPLSFAQQRLWFLDQLEPNNAFYNVPGIFRLTGQLSVVALQQSLNEIVRRHEVLRSTFTVVEGQPTLLINPATPLVMPLIDLSQLSESERETASWQLINEDAQRPFDLTQSPFMRVTIIRAGNDDHILILNMHHIICDGWSMGVLFGELGVLYEAYSHEAPSPLPDPPLQYADFAHWQRQWLQGAVLEDHLVYWREQLATAAASLELPTDRPRRSVSTFNGAGYTHQLSPALSRSIHELGRQEGVTLFMTLLAALQCLFYRYTGQEDICIGTPIANRNRAELEGLVGFFVNTLVLRADLSGEPTFRQLLRRVREAALGAYAHQDVPFEKLVEDLQPERTLSHTPLFQVLFALQNIPRQALQLTGLTLRREDVPSGTAKYDLTVVMNDTTDGLFCWFGYNSDLFEVDTIARQVRHFDRLLKSIVANPDQSISSLNLLSPAQDHQQLVEWNNTQTDFAETTCVHHLFELQAQRAPDSVAVVFEEDQLTYNQLNRRANQLAHCLRRLGVGVEHRVGLCAERSVDLMVGLLGILKAGGVYVPLDPALPKERLGYMLSDSGAEILLTQQHLVASLPEHNARILCLDADREAFNQDSEENPEENAQPANLVYLIYTSGSTGRPKGVAVEHRQLLNYVHGMLQRLDLPRDASYAIVSTFGADLGHTCLYPALCTGGTLHIVSHDRATNPFLFAEYFERHQIDCLKIVPSHLEALQCFPHPEQLMPRRRLVLGGEASRRAWVSELQRLAPQCSVLNHYGPTETTVGVLTHEIELGIQAVGSNDVEEIGMVPLGIPLPNTQVYVLSPHLQPLPIGVSGELFIGGAGVTRGYLNHPGLTAEKFIPHPFSVEPGARLYRSGDMARFLPSGAIEFLGRKDQQLKFHGYRVELSEIRGALNRHPQIRDSLIMMAKDQHGQDSLLAYYVSRQELAIATLRSFLGQNIIEETIPNVFIHLKKIPLTLNGKINLAALPTLDEARQMTTRSSIPPRTTAEEIIAEVWSEILGIKHLGVQDNFFEIGGHSLMATRVVSHLRAIFQVDIPLRRLFEKPTIEGLLGVIAEIWGDREIVEEIARTSRELEQLSAAEAEALLSEKEVVTSAVA
jgi:amino acid adenylation domain-containing protein